MPNHCGGADHQMDENALRGPGVHSRRAPVVQGQGQHGLTNRGRGQQT